MPVECTLLFIHSVSLTHEKDGIFYLRFLVSFWYCPTGCSGQIGATFPTSQIPEYVTQGVEMY